MASVLCSIGLEETGDLNSRWWKLSEITRCLSTSPTAAHNDQQYFLGLPEHAHGMELRRGQGSVSTLALCCFLAHNRSNEISNKSTTPDDVKDGDAANTNVFTLSTLKQHDGVEQQTIYVSVRRTVFDMSSGASFYGADGGYHVFAGHDATKNLALMSLDAADLDQPLFSPNNDEESTTLDDWVKKFRSKYPVVGRLVSEQTNANANHTDIAANEIEVFLAQAKLLANVLQAQDQHSRTLYSMHEITVLFFASGHMLTSEAIAANDFKVSMLLKTMGVVARALDSEMNRFNDFESYDFRTDDEFQAGLATVTHTQPRTDELVLRLSAFYYQKEKDPLFTLQSYQAWKATTQTQPRDNNNNNNINNTNNNNNSNNNNTTTTTTTTTTNNNNDNNNNNNTSIPSRQLASARMSPTTSASSMSRSNQNIEQREFNTEDVVGANDDNDVGVGVGVGDGVGDGVGVGDDVGVGGVGDGVGATVDTSSVADNTQKLSLGEVMDLVAAGKELPGCRKVVVEVQDDVEPSPSVLQRPLKPWEAQP